MISFDVSEFIERIDEMFHMVVEEGKTIEITKQGEIFARMEPVRQQAQSAKRVRQES